MVAILGTRGSFRGWAAVPLLLLGFLGPAASSGAVETALLGPEDFQRQAGPPRTETRTFSLSGASAPFLLHIDNGGDQGQFRRVSSAVVTLNGAVVVAPKEFNQTVVQIEKEVVLEADNVLTVEVRSAPGSGFTLSILGQAEDGPPGIEIQEPANGLVTADEMVDVSGVTVGLVESVEVNGFPATLDGDSFFASVLLSEGTNRLVVTASNSRGESASGSVSVRLDTSPPLVVIESPRNGDRLVSAAVTVAGTVNDIIPGATVNEDDVAVTVNGIPAAIMNRTFFVPDLPLELGINTLFAEAEDRAGNRSSRSITVTREPDLAGIRLEIIGGNNQRDLIGAPLPEPLSVLVLDSGGNPLAQRPVEFAVSRGDGLLGDPADSRLRTVLTDSFGIASTPFELGTRTGEGLHRVRATTPGSLTFAEFCATAEPGAPANISITLVPPNRGVAGQTLPDPLSVIVTDAGGNPVPEVLVTFEVEAGGGGFGGGRKTAEVLTNPDGIATAFWTLGLQPGTVNNEVSATFPGNPNFPATFLASGITPGRTQDTSVSGVVQNSAAQPISGVRAVIRGTALEAFTGPDGRFTIPGVPPGGHHLGILGSAANDPGTGRFFPDIDFAIEAISGVDNSMPQAVTLPFLNTENAKLVGGDEDVILEMDGVPGFGIKIFAHSVILHDGSRGQLMMSSSQVKFDKVPMAPPQGSTPLIVGTLQPGGIRFDPPAQVIYPNAEGLSPGDVADIFAFHHDIGQFVNVGPGTVSEDGSVVVSDPGFGIVQSGWHCLIRLPGPAADCANECSSRIEWTLTRNGNAGGTDTVRMAAADDPANAQEAQVTVTFSPGGGSNDASPVWSISDPGVAEIVGTAGSGNSVTVRAVAVGTALLTSPVYRIPLPDDEGGDKTCQTEVALEVGEKELVIEEPEDGDRLDITAAPEMPEVMARAVIRGVTPDPTPTTTFDWTVQILFNSNECPNGTNRNLDGQPFMASTTGGEYMPEFPEIRGGELRLKAQAE
ncbi:MAG: hypothetical protein KDD47_01605, partial [Acidobacteria bacterium]|nr:hypothetical protein [Acidobacteriota bacterium]